MSNNSNYSKPLTYAIALNEIGQETVHQYMGQEPSGRMFNELILDHNSTSIKTTKCVYVLEKGPLERFKFNGDLHLINK